MLAVILNEAANFSHSTICLILYTVSLVLYFLDSQKLWVKIYQFNFNQNIFIKHAYGIIWLILESVLLLLLLKIIALQITVEISMLKQII